MDLNKVMEDQETLQNEIYPDFMMLSAEKRLQDNLKHIIHEVIETERETNFKHWKQPITVDWVSVREELVDVFIFFMNACNTAEMSADELLNRTMVKQGINRERQRHGY